MKAKEYLVKFYDFICICAFVLASIGGTAYLFYFGAILFGVVNLGLVAMATPFIIKRVKNLIGKEE